MVSLVAVGLDQATQRDDTLTKRLRNRPSQSKSPNRADCTETRRPLLPKLSVIVLGTKHSKLLRSSAPKWDCSPKSVNDNTAKGCSWVMARPAGRTRRCSASHGSGLAESGEEAFKISHVVLGSDYMARPDPTREF